MQQVTITPPAVPGGPVTITQAPAGVPRTREELDALRFKRGELSNQLISAQNRRKEWAEQLAVADPAARSGIIARLKVLDDRIVRIESEIDRTGDMLANVPGHVLAETAVAPRVMDKVADNIVPITGILGTFVLFPLAFAFARLMWKRASVPAPQIDAGAHQRLEQLQQAVDAIAIEVERISEGQRFVTRMLNDRALGAGGAEVLSAPQAQAIRNEPR